MIVMMIYDPESIRYNKISVLYIDIIDIIKILYDVWFY